MIWPSFSMAQLAHSTWRQPNPREDFFPRVSEIMAMTTPIGRVTNVRNGRMSAPSRVASSLSGNAAATIRGLKENMIATSAMSRALRSRCRATGEGETPDRGFTFCFLLYH